MTDVLRSYGGLTAQERSNERRERLIAAAIEVVGTVGYRSATVDGISREAGLIKRYFYESFDSLEALLCVAYERIVADMRAAVFAHVADTEDPADMLTVALEGFLIWAEQERTAARVHVCEVLGVSDRIDELYRRTAEGFARDLAGLATASSDERVRAHSEMLGTLLVGGALHLVAQWLIEGYVTPREEILGKVRGLLSALLD